MADPTPPEETPSTETFSDVDDELINNVEPEPLDVDIDPTMPETPESRYAQTCDDMETRLRTLLDAVKDDPDLSLNLATTIIQIAERKLQASGITQDQAVVASINSNREAIQTLARLIDEQVDRIAALDLPQPVLQGPVATARRNTTPARPPMPGMQ